MKKIEVSEICVNSTKIPKAFTGSKILHISDLHRNVEVSEICVNSTKIPKAFTGSKILHISDLHRNVFGKRQSELIRISKELEP